MISRLLWLLLILLLVLHIEVSLICGTLMDYQIWWLLGRTLLLVLIVATVRWLATNPKETLILALLHRGRILCILCTYPSPRADYIEANVLHDDDKILIRWLNAVLPIYIAVVIEQWSEIHPNATGHKNSK